MLSMQVEKNTIIGRPSASPTRRARTWSHPPIAPFLVTLVLSARRNQTFPPDPLASRSAMLGPPSDAKALGSSTPYEILSPCFSSIAAILLPTGLAVILIPTLG